MVCPTASILHEPSLLLHPLSQYRAVRSARSLKANAWNWLRSLTLPSSPHPSKLSTSLHSPGQTSSCTPQALWTPDSVCSTPNIPPLAPQHTKMPSLKQIICLGKIIQWLPAVLGRVWTPLCIYKVIQNWVLYWKLGVIFDMSFLAIPPALP